MWTIWFAIGAFYSATAVAIGAFGAHALKGKLVAEDAVIFETATKYLTSQSLGLLAVALIMSRIDHVALKIAAPVMSVGILIFSGSLFGIVATGIRWLGAITPIGGSMIILGWLLATWATVSAQWN